MTIPAFLALVTVALASYRITRIVVADSISDSFRAWVWAQAYERVMDYDSLADTDERAVRRSWAWEKAYQLVSCPWCFGWHVSLLTYAAWFHWHVSFAKPIIAAVAVAGLQGFLASREG